jgi:hypothetical protein
MVIAVDAIRPFREPVKPLKADAEPLAKLPNYVRARIVAAGTGLVFEAGVLLVASAPGFWLLGRQPALNRAQLSRQVC